nr:MFS transporter [Chloroflexota bacterium]
MNTASPQPPPKSLPMQNLRVLALRNFFFGCRWNMVRAIWQPFVLSLGASMPVLGLLESIGGFQGIMSTATLSVGGWLSDRHGRKPFVVIASAFGIVAMVAFALAGWLREWRLLLPGVVMLGLTAIARPATESITAESVPPAERGLAFGRIGVTFAASGIFAPTLGGFLASRYGFLAVLLVGALLEFVTLCLVAFALHETLHSEARTPLIASEFWALLKRIMTPPSGLRSFYVAVTIDMFAYGMGAGILPGLLTKVYRFTPFQLGLMASVSSASWAISQWFIGQWVDRRGYIPFLALSEAIAVFVATGWLIVQSFPAFLMLEIFWGLVVATWTPAFTAWIANSVPERQRAEEIGRLGTFRGLLSFPAPYVGGLIYEAFGFRGPILGNLIGAAVAMILLLAFVREPNQS